MKLRTEFISNSEEEEIVLRLKEKSERTDGIYAKISDMLNDRRLCLTLNGTEHFIAINEILFFETEENRIAAHTVGGMYYTHKKLYELERMLPATFIRVSKSCILNVSRINYVNRNLTGASEVGFEKTNKKVFVSRIYFKILKERLQEMR
ncbi:MAG: LytTR family transcriptional regulator [Clostridia bacterium]|nr:LytTR family transcriptional regulator [Clostridia bacterium]